jgi:hypothetical protein
LLTNGVTPANLHMVVHAIAGPTGLAGTDRAERRSASGGDERIVTGRI